MLYDYKEYLEFAFDTPMLKMQEKVIVEKIFNLLNSKKYNSIEEIKKAFPNYEDFLKKNNLSIPIKMFGNTLKEDDFFEILEKIGKLINKKNSIDESKIKSETIDNDEFGIVQGKEKSYVLNNEMGQVDISTRMQDEQKNQENLQTSNPQNNTENIAKKMENEKTLNLNLQNLNEINQSMLTEQQLEYFNFAVNLDKPFKMDVEEGILYDSSEDKVYKIVKEDESLMLLGDNDEIVYSTKEEHSKLVLSPNNYSQEN